MSEAESATLEHCQLPGVNRRFGMPAQPQGHRASRESDLSAILAYSPLPAQETKRALVLRACEDMMKQREPERDFLFLDRCFVEKFERQALRQQIAAALRLQPELAYAYYPGEDALLLALYFKNPPGRLLRR